MILTQQINFINHCTKDMDKFSLYLSISDKKITCEPSLALKYYYKWSLKHTYKLNLEDLNINDYFNKIITKEEYKVLGKMEYTDVKNLVVAHYSLGEISFHEGKIELCQEYFSKVISILEEVLKNGNKYGHEVMRERDDVSFFELMMWAKKAIADTSSMEEAIEQYETVVSESDFLYLQKNYCIYTVAKNLEILNKAYEAARNIIKVYPDYENINVDVVMFLKKHREYYNALEFIVNEYKRTEDKQWIDIIREICIKDDNFNIQCVEKVLYFSDILLWNLKLSEWTSVILCLYKATNLWDTALKRILEYLRKSFSKINCNEDFTHFPQCVSIISKIYEHIRINKYENKELREYEFDFDVFLLKSAFYNRSYNETFESATKLSLNICANNKVKDIKNLVDDFKKVSIEEVKLNHNSLKQYPWSYLKDKLGYVMKQCSLEELSNGNNVVSEKSLEANSFTDIKESEDKRVIYEINQDNLKEVILEGGDSTKDEFYTFKNKLDREIDFITEKINEEQGVLSNELDTLYDGIFANKEIETEINTIVKEFTSKIKGDLQFLKEYGESKIKIAIPDILENNLNIVDELKDIKTLKTETEEKLKEIIEIWGKDNLEKLLWEQFNVNLSKYTNLYLEHMEIINKIIENRKKVEKVCEDFNSETNEIMIIPNEQVYDKFMNHYKEFLNELNYDIRVLPDEKILNTVTSSVRNIFAKSESRLENVKNRIQLQISEEKLQMADRLTEKVFLNLIALEEKLQGEVEVLFSDILKEVINDRNSIEKKYHVAKLNHNEIKSRNEEIQILLDFIRVELGKYHEQVSLGIVYAAGECYKIQ